MTSGEALPDPLVSTTVGRFRLTRLLGKGGMGRVYEALDPTSGSRVAIKVISEDVAGDPELAERFFAEARAVNFIRHENIVNVLDLLTLPDGRPVIVMELLEGKTLRELIRLGPSPLGGVVHVMLDVLAGLAAAHAAGVIHRDLKPDNILVTTSGRAKVLDFGIAKLARPTPGKAMRTRTGAVLGTPEYMAPEQIRGAHVDARTDVYAAGVVLFEALTGRRPFDADSDFEVMRMHMDEAPPAARSLRASISAELEGVLAGALAKRAEDRFASATAMATALHSASAALPASEWRAFQSGGRAYVRTPVAPVAPAPHASVMMHAEQSGSLPTRSDRPPSGKGSSRDEAPTTDAPTKIATPRTARTRPTWVVPIAGASVIALTSIVIAVAVRSTGEGAGSGVAGSGSGVAGSGSGSGVAGSGSDSGSGVAGSGSDSDSEADSDLEAEADSIAVAVPGAGSGSGSAAAVAPSSGIGFDVPIAFDATRFDPVAFYPEAVRLAQRLLPDAGLVSFTAHNFHHDGYVDLSTAQPYYNGYAFRSRSNKDLQPVASPGMRTCYVMITFTATHVRVRSMAKTAKQCERRFVAAPRCTFADIVGRTPAGTSLSFSADGNGKATWFLDRKLKSADCVNAPAIAKAAPVEPASVPAEPIEPFDEPVDIATFDPIAYTATAHALAKRMQPDAVLVQIRLMPVHAPGALIFDTGSPTKVQYVFRSPAFGQIKDLSVGANCLVEVSVAKFGGARVRMSHSDECKDVAVRAPRCTLTALWSKAVAKGMMTSGSSVGWVSYGWTARGWSIRGTSGGEEKTFLLPDDCP